MISSREHGFRYLRNSFIVHLTSDDIMIFITDKDIYYRRPKTNCR